MQKIVSYLCEEYLGVEPLPVFFDNIDGVISILNLKNKFIVVNRKYKTDKITVLAAIAHELEHYYQILYANSLDTPKAKRWKQELKNYIYENDFLGNATQEIEIDSEAFAVVILESEFGIKYQNPNKNLQSIIDKYIQLGKLLDND